MFKPDFIKQGGLVPAVVQDAENGQVLMLAYMNEEAFDLTVSTGTGHYFSRSRNRIWKKGEESGNIQKVDEIRIDCDEDTVLLKVRQTGAACHEGYRSCFFRVLENGDFKTDMDRLDDPEKLYRGKKHE